PLRTEVKKVCPRLRVKRRNISALSCPAGSWTSPHRACPRPVHRRLPTPSGNRLLINGKNLLSSLSSKRLIRSRPENRLIPIRLLQQRAVRAASRRLNGKLPCLPASPG